MSRLRIAALIGGVIVAIYLVEWAARGLSGGTPGGPTASSYATASDGTAAWAELLARNGHAVGRLRVTPRNAELPPSATAVVLEPPEVLKPDTAALESFVRSGGRLIAGGTDTTWLAPIVGRLEASDQGVVVARPLAPEPEVAGVRSVVTTGAASWERLGRARAILGTTGRPVAAVADVGRGRIVLLADDSMLSNALLAKADNARFSLGIAGPPRRDVLFFENYHGYGTASRTGLSALPANWRAAILLGFLAVIVYMLARGRRLGPPELEQREFDPPRREYVEAMGGILARTRAPGEALEPLRAEVRRRLGGPETPEAIAEAARARGLTPEEAAAAARPVPSGEDVLPLGRALARLGSTRGRGAWKG
jgi:hypothetical protein